jgi:hypothetical protein
MFQGVEWQCDLILCKLDIDKSDLEKVASVMFSVGEWP